MFWNCLAKRNTCADKILPDNAKNILIKSICASRIKSVKITQKFKSRESSPPRENRWVNLLTTGGPFSTFIHYAFINSIVHGHKAFCLFVLFVFGIFGHSFIFGPLHSIAHHWFDCTLRHVFSANTTLTAYVMAIPNINQSVHTKWHSIKPKLYGLLWRLIINACRPS